MASRGTRGSSIWPWWTGAPANYMMLALAARDYHERREPAQPQWHDVPNSLSEWLMDDPVVAEPDLGPRAWMACDALDASAREVFGAEAVNASEREADGGGQRPPRSSGGSPWTLRASGRLCPSRRP